VRSRNRPLKKLSILVLFLFLAQVIVPVSAKANSVLFESFSPLSSTNPEGLRNDHHLRSMDVYVYAANPDLINIKLTFAGTVGPTTFTSSNLLLRIKILPFLADYVGNAGHLWLDAPKVPYEGTKKLSVTASAYVSPTGVAGSARKDVSSCGATTWMDDVPNQNVVSFELSRNCFDLANTLYVITHIEEDIYNNVQTRDSKYVPTSPMYLDMRNIPRPPKVIPKKDQTVSASTPQREYFVDNNAIQINASSSGGVPVTYNSRTPEICLVTSTGLIQPKAAGSCQVAVEAPGSTTLNPAPPVLVTVTLIRKAQSLYFDPPGMVYMSQGYLKLAISSEFNLPVQVVSTSPTICTFPLTATEPTVVQLLRPGTCSFRVSQAGNAIYNPREGVASFEIYADPVAKPTATAKPKTTPKPKTPPKPKTGTSPTAPEKGVDISVKGEVTGGNTGGTSIDGGGSVGGGVKKKITCVKPGAKNREISGVDPKCPTGYKKK